MAESVLNLPAPGRLPEAVELHQEDLTQVAFTGRELALIKQHTGKTLSELLEAGLSDDLLVMFGWLKLRREGHRVEWDDMLDVVVRFITGVEVDPTNGGSSATSPASAATGA